jgi:hypothetical protein
MGLGSLQADIIERRSENGARTVFDYQYPQRNPEAAPQGALPVHNKTDAAPYWAHLPAGFILTLITNDVRKVLAVVAKWSLADFEALAKRSPRMSARLNVILAKAFTSSR